MPWPVSNKLLIGKRCLVLDDEFLIALDIQQTLEFAGAAHVACVATVAEALALAAQPIRISILPCST